MASEVLLSTLFKGSQAQFEQLAQLTNVVDREIFGSLADRPAFIYAPSAVSLVSGGAVEFAATEPSAPSLYKQLSHKMPVAAGLADDISPSEVGRIRYGSYGSAICRNRIHIRYQDIADRMNSLPIQSYDGTLSAITRNIEPPQAERAAFMDSFSALRVNNATLVNSVVGQTLSKETIEFVTDDRDGGTAKYSFTLPYFGGTAPGTSWADPTFNIKAYIETVVSPELETEHISPNGYGAITVMGKNVFRAFRTNESIIGLFSSILLTHPDVTLDMLNGHPWVQEYLGRIIVTDEYYINGYSGNYETQEYIYPVNDMTILGSNMQIPSINITQPNDPLFWMLESQIDISMADPAFREIALGTNGISVWGYNYFMRDGARGYYDIHSAMRLWISRPAPIWHTTMIF